MTSLPKPRCFPSNGCGVRGRAIATSSPRWHGAPESPRRLHGRTRRRRSAASRRGIPWAAARKTSPRLETAELKRVMSLKKTYFSFFFFFPLKSCTVLCSPCSSRLMNFSSSRKPRIKEFKTSIKVCCRIHNLAHRLAGCTHAYGGFNVPLQSRPSPPKLQSPYDRLNLSQSRPQSAETLEDRRVSVCPWGNKCPLTDPCILL